MKTTIVPISVEPHMFKKVICLPSEHMLDLIATVSAASVLNVPLTADTDNKIAAAFIMLAHANTMLEQCGCEIDTKITNKVWTHPSVYRTEMDGMESTP